MTTHELETGQTILLEVVPRTAYDIEYSAGKRYGYTYSQLYYTLGGFRHHMDFDSFVEEGTVVGTIQHPGVISFDCAPFVEPLIVRTEVPARAAGFRDWHAFRNYMNDKYPNACKTKEASFLSLLQSLGRYWVNPLGRKPERVVPFMGAGQYTENQLWALDEYNKILKAWQEAESRKLSVEQMVVVIQIKKV